MDKVIASAMAGAKEELYAVNGGMSCLTDRNMSLSKINAAAKWKETILQ